MLVVLLLLSRMRGNGAWACKAFISLLLVGGRRRRRRRQALGAFVEPLTYSHTFSSLATHTHSYRKDTTERTLRLSAGLFSFPLPPSSPSLLSIIIIRVQQQQPQQQDGELLWTDGQARRGP